MILLISKNMIIVVGLSTFYFSEPANKPTMNEALANPFVAFIIFQYKCPNNVVLVEDYRRKSFPSF